MSDQVEFPRLHVDFNEMFEDGAVDLRGCKEELTALGASLRNGLEVVLWDEDVQREGYLKLDSRRGEWVGIPSRLGFPVHVTIEVEGDGPKISLHWDEFDGDDCFGKHWITVWSAGARDYFDFGASSVWGLRKPTRFLESALTEKEESRVLDAGSFVIEQDALTMKFTVRSEGKLLEFLIQSPKLQMDRTFLNMYGEDRPH